MSYDNKFKKRVLAFLDKGHSQQETSVVFGIGTTTIKEWRKRSAAGTLFDINVRRRQPKKIHPDQLQAYISSHPDAYLSEIASEFGCSSPAVHKALKKLGITRKKRR